MSMEELKHFKKVDNIAEYVKEGIKSGRLTVDEVAKFVAGALNRFSEIEIVNSEKLKSIFIKNNSSNAKGVLFPLFPNVRMFVFLKQLHEITTASSFLSESYQISLSF